MDEYAEQEAKLIEVPKGVATFQAELRHFQQERGCAVVGIRTGQMGDMGLLVRALGLPDLGMVGFVSARWVRGAGGW